MIIVVDPVAPHGERTKILDFGIAKFAGQGEAGRGATKTGLVIGTPSYMAPEQCRGAGLIDAKTDVYSLGIVLYLAVSGRLPFIAEGGGEVLGMHLFKAPPPLQEHAPSAPAELVSLVHRMLLKSREDRPSMPR